MSKKQLSRDGHSTYPTYPTYPSLVCDPGAAAGAKIGGQLGNSHRLVKALGLSAAFLAPSDGTCGISSYLLVSLGDRRQSTDAPLMPDAIGGRSVWLAL